MAFTDPNRILIAREIQTDIPPNKRIDINGTDAPNGIAFYTGHANETFPGVIQPDTAADALSVTMSSPLTAGHAGSSFSLNTGLNPADEDYLDMNSQNFSVNVSSNLALNGPGYGGGGALTYGLITSDGTGPYWDFNAPRIFLRDNNVANDNGVVVENGQISSMHDSVWKGTAVTPLSNAWVDTAGARFGYLKDATGTVHLRGLIRNGTAVTMVTLPVGYRPSSNLDFTVQNKTGSGIASIGVNTAGVVQISTNFVSGTMQVYLDVISFPTD